MTQFNWFVQARTLNGHITAAAVVQAPDMAAAVDAALDELADQYADRTGHVMGENQLYRREHWYALYASLYSTDDNPSEVLYYEACWGGLREVSRDEHAKPIKLTRDIKDVPVNHVPTAEELMAQIQAKIAEQQAQSQSEPEAVKEGQLIPLFDL